MVERGALITSARPVDEAAVILTRAIEDADRAHGRARVAIAGGSAASVIGVVRKNLAPKLWRRVFLTWVDERCVPLLSPDSNRGAAYKEGWLDVSAPCAFELPLYLDDETPDAACSRVRQALVAKFHNTLDVLLLGLGEDGHIASLFPSRPSLTERRATVLAISDSPKPPPSRITLTLPLLDTAATQLVVAVGEGKRKALAQTLAGDTALPLTHLHHVQLVTDLSFGETS